VSGTILVTGGASGIGRAVVEGVLAEGWRAVAIDLPGRPLDEMRAAHAPDRLRCTDLDVTDEAAVTAEVAAAERDFGPVAGLVNSAGIARDVGMLATDAGLFRRTLEVNVIGSFLFAREAARVMRGRGGAIVNISSVSGIQGNEGRVAYGASKGAVITMSKVMAVELAPLGIRVNVIAPGPIETPLVAEVHTDEVRATWLASVPMRRYGAPADIAAAAVFLLDDAKSGFVTGHTLCVDGGFTIAGIQTGSARAANADA
jgi:NAD(P)-dependent dehydrogenase (short-subunit alcohol dehydrogenase family)